MFVLSLILTGCFTSYLADGTQVYPNERPGAQAPTSAWSHTGLFDRAQVGGVIGGLTLYEGGDQGIIGMDGLACEVRTISGDLSTDIIVSEDSAPEVLDGDGHNVLAAAGEGLTIFPRGGGAAVSTGMVHAGASLQVQVPGLLEAQLTDQGLVALRATDAGCALGWLSASDEVDRDWSEAVELSVPEEACLVNGVSVDPLSGQVWLGVGEVMRMGLDGVLYTGVAADRVAWDPHAGRLYAITRGGTLLSVLDSRGLLLEEFELGQPLVGVAHLGANAAVLLITAPEGGGTGLLVIDPDSGQVLADRSLGRAAVSSVAVSPDGAVLGVVSGDVARFFDVVL